MVPPQRLATQSGSAKLYQASAPLSAGKETRHTGGKVACHAPTTAPESDYTIGRIYTADRRATFTG